MIAELPAIPHLGIDDLERWDGVLLDAYGVLNDGRGPLPGAGDLLLRLERAGRPWCVVTNDASRLPETAAGRFRRWGLEVAPERIVSSGSLLPGWFAAEGLRGSRAVVLGPADSRTWVERAGGVVADLADGEDPGFDADVVVAADETGIALERDLAAVASLLIRRVDAGEPLRLVLPNPDLVFPRGPGRYGLTAGALAAVLEAILEDRYGRRADLRFTRLGKPEVALFEEARRRLGVDRLVMVGDQLQTDVAGAKRAGITAVLAGLEPPRDLATAAAALRPDFRLRWPVG